MTVMLIEFITCKIEFNYFTLRKLTTISIRDRELGISGKVILDVPLSLQLNSKTSSHKMFTIVSQHTKVAIADPQLIFRLGTRAWPCEQKGNEAANLPR